MNQLKEMLEAYRNGERGLPTYDELADIESRHSAIVSALKRFSNLDKSVASDLWAIRPEFCEQARLALAESERAK